MRENLRTALYCLTIRDEAPGEKAEALNTNRIRQGIHRWRLYTVPDDLQPVTRQPYEIENITGHNSTKLITIVGAPTLESQSREQLARR
jgi:hypothetical protein